MSRLSGISTRTAAIVGGAILLVLVVGVAIASGIGHDDVGDDSVAVVDGTQISVEDFNTALEQAAVRQGLKEPPAADDPAYTPLRDEALNQLLDAAWIDGEAKERGVDVTDLEVQQEFQKTKDENFKTEKEYQDFLEESGFTQEDIDERVRLQLISTKIQDKITEETPKVSDSDIEEFYEANKSQLQQPPSRNIRLVLAKDEKDADEAKEALSADNSPESWDTVAKDLSTDDATKDKGGVTEGVTEGTFPDPLNSEIFSAEQGEVVGPVEADDGFYVFQVDTITEESVQPLEEAKPAIQQQLEGQLQQESFSAFLTDYRDRWTELTICGDDYVIERCDNFEGATQPCPDPTLPEDQQKLQLEQQGCPPPVLPNSPASPGSILPFVPVQGQPQRPHPAGSGEAPPQTGLPPGSVPGGAVPGGAAPQGAAPQGQAPPQAQP